MALDFNSLSKYSQERLVSLYESVKNRIMVDHDNCNNWVKSYFFESAETGFSEFVESISIAVTNGDISWYSEDEDIIEWCIRSLRVADFIHKVD